MTLTPTLASLEALYRKLEREMYRAYHSRDPIHKADHFYNFCITAHSMRDYFLERVGEIQGSKRQAFESQWGSIQALAAAAEIANSAKHFQLREPKTKAPRVPKTKSVKGAKGKVVNVYASRSGEIATELVSAPTISVVVSDGSRYELYTFMNEVLEYWRTFMRAQGIKMRRQSLSRLIGGGT